MSDWDDVTTVKPEDSHNFPASAPVDGTEYDPEGIGRSNTMGYPPRPLPYKTIYGRNR